MNDLQQARIDAAAKALRADEGFMEEVHSALEVSWSEYIARLVLVAADAHLPTVEQIAEVIQRTRWRAIDSGTNPRIDYTDSMDIARAVRALFGEVAGNE